LGHGLKWIGFTVHLWSFHRHRRGLLLLPHDLRHLIESLLPLRRVTIRL
jgi:hypothetical protein